MAMTAESNSQALARTLLLSALHRITRISNSTFLLKIRVYLRREGLYLVPIHNCRLGTN
jgi:hypothetical protein